MGYRADPNIFSVMDVIWTSFSFNLTCAWKHFVHSFWSASTWKLMLFGNFLAKFCSFSVWCKFREVWILDQFRMSFEKRIEMSVTRWWRWLSYLFHCLAPLWTTEPNSKMWILFLLKCIVFQSLCAIGRNLIFLV